MNSTEIVNSDGMINLDTEARNESYIPRTELKDENEVNEVFQTVREFSRSIYTYDEDKSLYENRSMALEKYRELLTYLRKFENLPNRIFSIVNNIDINKITPPKNYIPITELFTPKPVKTIISGSEYMSHFKAQKYILNKYPDISEIKNFFYIIEKNKANDLLKNFKNNKEALLNIITGLIDLACSYRNITITYENSYDVIYKNQKFENMLFNYDYYLAFKNFVFTRQLQTGEKINIEISQSDIKNSIIVLNQEKARSKDDLPVDYIYDDLDLLCKIPLDNNSENVEFSKETLKKFITNEDLLNNVFDFIDGSILVLPEILEKLKIPLKKEEFKFFQYQELLQKESIT